jgi:uncharacterized protein (DUF4415 family)
MNKRSKTDWERLEAMMDEEIDTSDIPPLDEAFFARATRRGPHSRVAVTVSVDADVLAWYRAQGSALQQRMNAALRIYAEAHKDQAT